MAFEQLIASDDRAFVAACLQHYAYGRIDPENDCDPKPGLPTRPTRKVTQRCSSFRQCAGICLFEDNPRTFEGPLLDENTSKEDFKAVLYPELWTAEVPDHQLYTTSSLEVWEHDTRVELALQQGSIELDSRDRNEYGWYAIPSHTLAAARVARNAVLARMHDRSKLWMPSTYIATQLHPADDGPVVRAGTSHRQALVEFLQSPQAKGQSPPLGFGAMPGTSEGLPEWVGRVP